jgi:hypothetical protein
MPSVYEQMKYIWFLLNKFLIKTSNIELLAHNLLF